MSTQESLDYARVAQAIAYIRENFKNQPDLDEVAGRICLSPAHFQRLFTAWAGVSPKKFLQYISIEYAKNLLKESTLADVAYNTGLSGTSRLHDLFIHIEGMTPGEYKNGGEKLSINYSFAESPFGNILVAATEKGICHMAFADEPAEALDALQQKFPRARYCPATDALQENALSIFSQDWSKPEKIKLHLKGTNFQLKVWKALLDIPSGQLTTYGDMAAKLQNPRASRAVGTAIGDNPIAFLIPCHRVIRSSGELGGYHWGLNRKAAMIGWEVAKNAYL
jgi:O-6-methylguanine DNA methyltransferase